MKMFLYIFFEFGPVVKEMSLKNIYYLQLWLPFLFGGVGQFV